MYLNRRTFLRLAGTGYLASLTSSRVEAFETGDDIFAAAYRNREGKYGFAILNHKGKLIDKFDLPSRGHDVVANPQNRKLVAIARRPGNFALVVDLDGRDPPFLFQSPEDRHFYGHGVFSLDGKLFYTTENDFENAQGIIGIYDATDRFKRLGEYTSHGIGPHELVLFDQGKTLCVANGGIETHPDFGRQKLNLHNMKPSIVLINARNGDLVEQHTLPAQLSKVSTRHMDIDSKQNIWIGCQYQGALSDEVPLLMKLKPGENLEFDILPDEYTDQLRQYVGSVSCNPGSETIAITSPKGDVAFIIDQNSNKIIRSMHSSGLCGAAADKNAFVFSGSDGTFASENHSLNWDNHIGIGRVKR